MHSTLLTAAALAALLLPGVARADDNGELQAQLDDLQSRVDSLESKLGKSSETPFYPSPEFQQRLQRDLQAYRQLMKSTGGRE